MTKSSDALAAFFQRARDAEERLAKLEAALATRKQDDNEVEELEKKVDQLQLKIEETRETSLKEVEQLAAENAKLRYRITHLVRALKEADDKLASKRGDDS